MRLNDFREVVKSHVRVDGNAYIRATSVAEWNALISAGLKALTAEYPIIYDDAVTFTVQVSDRYYNMRDESVFSKPVSMPELVFIGGKNLPYCEWNAVDKVSFMKMPPGESSYFTVISPFRLALSNPPQEVNEGVVMGWVLHPELNYDNEELLIPDEYAAMAAAYVAWWALQPYSSGESAARIRGILQSLRDSFAGFVSYASKTHGRVVRGRGV